MRIFILFLCTSVFGLAPLKTMSQNKIIIDVDKTVSIDEVFTMIIEQTDYKFIYRKDLFNNAPKIELKKGTISLNKLLNISVEKLKHIQIILTENKTILLKNIRDKNGQQRILKGTITDTNNVPIPGVTVLIKGTNTGVSTDLNGNYFIKISSDSNVLMFSYIGYKTQEILVGASTQLDVVLEEEISALDAVVINAGYYNVKEREKTGSIVKVESKNIEKQPVNNVMSALTGQVSGLTITQSSGVAGGGFDIQIRGRNSIGNNLSSGLPDRPGNSEPLYIINGVPYDGSSLSFNEVNFAGIGNISPLNSINPADIDSIEILKDADATAIYGARGANGVVLITTKKGAIGKTKISVNQSTTLSQIPKFIDVLDREQYLELKLEAFTNDGILPTDPNRRIFNEFNGNWDTTRNTDWQKVLVGKTAIRRNAQVSISGGSERTQFLFSTGLVNENTIYIEDSNYRRLSFQSNINHTSENERFRFNLSTNYGLDKNVLPAIDLYNLAITLSPVAPRLFNDDGSLNWERTDEGFGTWRNPIAQLNQIFESETQNLVANASLSYKLRDNLEIKTNMGYTDVGFEEFQANPASRTNDPLLFGSSISDFSRFSTLRISNNDRRSWIVEPQLNWNFAVKDLKVNFLVGGTFQSRTSVLDSEERRGFASDDLILDRTAAFTISPLAFFEEEDKISSVYSRLNFNYKGKYIVNFTGRRDGSSRFGKNNRFGNFGAIGAAWILSKESFMKPIKNVVNFAKLRVSYGLTGSDNISINEYAPLFITANGNTNYNNIPGLRLRNIGNPDLQWEENKKLEAALEIGLFKDRISFSTAYYRNRSGNQLISIPQPITTGFSSFPVNLDAVVENTGLEIEFRTKNIQTDNFSWTTNFNYTRPRNKLVKFDDLENSVFRNQFIIGESLSIRKVFTYLGVNPETGSYEFEDVNNDGAINFRDRRASTDFVDFAPQYFGGLTNTFKYKNWEFNFLFQYSKRLGPSFYSLGLSSFNDLSSNVPAAFYNRWRQTGNLGTDVQQLTTGFDLGNSNILESDANVEDASFIRLRTAFLSYTLPNEILKGVNASFYLQGQNLFILTKYFAPDPELGPTVVPTLRQFTLGANFTF